MSRHNPVVRLVVAANLYTVVAVVLVLLRIGRQIDWPWLPVAAPLWAPILLTGVLVAIFGLATAIMNSFSR